MNKKVEILSPAGNIESFKAAIENGADAVYMGVNKFNARQMADNFTVEKYIEAIHYAHARATKVYLTLNTLLYDDEIKDAISLVIELYSHGLDAVIVQDMGLATIIKQVVPQLPLHASTQMTIHNLKQVKYLEKLGFKRVVLARELSIAEIENICKNTDMEIEVFVHGALCVSYSGQCLMSSMIGLRSGNRGKCAQPCRMKYSLYESTNSETNKSYKSDKLLYNNKYLLSKKDIFGLKILPKLIQAGVKSLKLEGRGKTSEYVALVTDKYRKYLDNIISKASLSNNYEIESNDEDQLLQIFNRSGISEGYLNGIEYSDSITLQTPKNTGILLGNVMDQHKEYIKIKLNTNIDMHDGIEIYSEEKVVSTIVTCIKEEKFSNKNSESLKGEFVWLGDINKKVKKGSPVYKTSSSKLNENLRESYMGVGFKRKIGIYAKAILNKNKEIIIELEVPNGKKVRYNSSYIPEEAKTKAIDEEFVSKALVKTNDTPYYFLNLTIVLDEGLYVPVSKLNEIRRNALQKLYGSYEINKNVETITKNLNSVLNSNINCEKLAESKAVKALYIYKYNLNKDYISQFKAKNINITRIYLNISDVINNEAKIFESLKSFEIYVAIPNIVNNNLDNYINNKLEYLVKLGVKGFLVGNVGYISIFKELKEKYNIELIADYCLNITNIYSAMWFYSQGFDTIVPSIELSDLDVQNMAKYISVEIVKDLVCVMSSRYCILGSLVSNKNKAETCKFPCKKSNYYLKDTYGEKYDIICDSIDCTMKIVKKLNSTQEIKNETNIDSIRYCVL